MGYAAAKLRKRELPGAVLCWFIIAVLVGAIAFPFIYILSTALKSDQGPGNKRRQDTSGISAVGKLCESLGIAGFSG